jgi:hypothetical protein
MVGEMQEVWRYRNTSSLQFTTISMSVAAVTPHSTHRIEADPGNSRSCQVSCAACGSCIGGHIELRSL